MVLNRFLFVFLLLSNVSFAENIQTQSQDVQAQTDFYESPFSYQYRTEVVIKKNKSFSLSPIVEEFAKVQESHLNTSKYFDLDFIRDPAKVRAHHIAKKHNKKDVGKIVEFFTEDDELISCTYFNRGSDKLLVVGEGFTNARELLTSYLALFPDYDLVLFDFRGQGYRPFDLFDPFTWPINLAKVTFGMDSQSAMLGKDEEKDVFAVVAHFKSQKEYKHVYGVSLCYSSFIFLKAQALRPGLFDKIILDGCWLSLRKLIDKLKKDLKMLVNPQQGGFSKVWPLSEWWVQDTVESLARHVWGLQIDHDLNALDYISDIKDTPLLFFHSKDDLMVTREEFEQRKPATIKNNLIKKTWS